LTWPSSSQSASRLTAAPFADRDGLVVFEQQPSGMLAAALLAAGAAVLGTYQAGRRRSYEYAALIARTPDIGRSFMQGLGAV
jgi:hypothetical protein